MNPENHSVLQEMKVLFVSIAVVLGFVFLFSNLLLQVETEDAHIMTEVESLEVIHSGLVEEVTENPEKTRSTPSRTRAISANDQWIYSEKRVLTGLRESGKEVMLRRHLGDTVLKNQLDAAMGEGSAAQSALLREVIWEKEQEQELRFESGAH